MKTCSFYVVYECSVFFSAFEQRPGERVNIFVRLVSVYSGGQKSAVAVSRPIFPGMPGIHGKSALEPPLGTALKGQSPSHQSWLP